MTLLEAYRSPAGMLGSYSFGLPTPHWFPCRLDYVVFLRCWLVVDFLEKLFVFKFSVIGAIFDKNYLKIHKPSVKDVYAFSPNFSSRKYLR